MIDHWGKRGFDRVKRAHILLLGVLSAGLFQLPALNADPLPAGSTCTTETLDNYLAAGFSCMIGVFTFNDFTFTASPIPQNAAVASPNQIYVIPQFSGGSYSLIFSGAGPTLSNEGTVFTAAPGQIITYLMSFVVDPLPSPIGGGSASLIGSDPTTLTTVFQPLVPLASPTTIFVTDSTCQTRPCDVSASTTFAPATTLLIDDILTLTGPASLKAFGNGITPAAGGGGGGNVPEPADFLMVGTGLLAAVGLRLRRRI